MFSLFCINVVIYEEKTSGVILIGEMGGQETYITVEPPWSFLPKQVATLESVKRYKFTLYSGSVGAGKTLLLAHAAIEACVNNPGTVGIIGSLTYTQLTNVVWTVFNEELMKYEDLLRENNLEFKLVTRRVESTGKMLIEFFNGSRIHFLACEDEMKLRGYTIDFFALDEPIDIDEGVFTQLMARMRGKHLKASGRKPFALLTTNPGAETHWIYQRFFAKKGKEYNVIQTTTRENVFLPEGYVESMLEAYDADWISRFIDGKWGAFKGQIYKNFNEKKHVGDYKNYDDIQYYIAGVDWGIRHPSGVLTIGITSDKKAIIVEEYFKSELTSKQVCDEIAKLDRKYEYRKIFVDSAALDLIVQLQQRHLPALKSDKHVEPGIGKVKSMFLKDMILIDKGCKELIRELLSYRYDKDTEKPVKRDDDLVDALRYALFTHRAWNNRTVLGSLKKNLWGY